MAMSHSTSPPTSTAQIRFLEQIQRILSEGQFTATYKFALLHALADLSVECGPTSAGAALTLTVSSIADRFVELYLPQARPYSNRGVTEVLEQNRGRPAAVVTALKEPAQTYGPTSATLQPDRVPPKAIRRINETIRDQPLWKLQTVAGGERLDFLYENLDDKTLREITLRPGVAYCFRAFHPLIISMVRQQWERWIRKQNPRMLDEAADLHAFLFGTDRQDLSGFRDALLEVHGPRCFYRETKLTDVVEVDHFVPWSRYPMDLGHNLVPASRKANSQKADLLPGMSYLERWLSLCIDRRKDLEVAFNGRGLRHDLPASLAIVEWSYGAVERSGGQVWDGDKNLVPLHPGWRDRVTQARRDLDLA